MRQSNLATIRLCCTYVSINYHYLMFHQWISLYNGTSKPEDRLCAPQIELLKLILQLSWKVARDAIDHRVRIFSDWEALNRYIVPQTFASVNLHQRTVRLWVQLTTYLHLIGYKYKLMKHVGTRPKTPVISLVGQPLCSCKKANLCETLDAVAGVISLNERTCVLEPFIVYGSNDGMRRRRLVIVAPRYLWTKNRNVLRVFGRLQRQLTSVPNVIAWS